MNTPMASHAAPRQPYGPAPVRRPLSVRRTSSIDVTWPQGRGEYQQLQGQARDVFTEADGALQVLAHNAYVATVSPDRTLRSLECEPSRAAAQGLAGTRIGGQFRKGLLEVMQQEHEAASPLYLVLDDLPGASLVSAWAWSRWPSQEHNDHPQRFVELRRRILSNMEGVCLGFKAGSTSLQDVQGTILNAMAVPSLVAPQDPEGWHELPSPSGVALRRARRIDVWLDGDRVQVDAMFQDSGTTPEGHRAAVHEYSLRATMGRDNGVLEALSATPHVLPYPECPSAVANIQTLVGTPMHLLRQTVLQHLAGTAGCTHLNDALRSLADVPALAQKLEKALQAFGRAGA